MWGSTAAVWAIVALAHTAGAHPVAASNFRHYQASNVVNPLFSNGPKPQCVNGCSVSAWGAAAIAHNSVPGDLRSPDIGLEVVAIVSTRLALAVLRADGSVRAWGDSATGGSNVPEDVTNPDPGVRVVAIAATECAFAALKSDGSVSTWGDWNCGGNAPTDVSQPLTGAAVATIASTSRAFAALKEDGSVFVWGDTDTGGINAPANVTTITALASTARAFAALDTDGSVHVWGDTTMGGAGVPADISYPFAGGSKVKHIASTNYAFAALKEDGSVSVWGDSTFGGADVPSDVSNPSPGYEIAAIFATDGLFATLDDNGTVSTWGGGSGTLPEDVSNPSQGASVLTIASSSSAFAALKEDGSVSAWGNGFTGGNNVPTDVSNPLPGANVIGIASNYYAFAAIKADGSVSAWGSPVYGGSVAADVAVPAAAGAEVVAIASADSAFAALKADGSVSAWGADGQNEDNVPVDVASPQRGEEVMAIGSARYGFAALKRTPRSTRAPVIQVGDLFSCALLSNWYVKCWGMNDSGQLGVSHTNSIGDDPFEMGNYLETANLGSQKLVIALSTGGSHVCAVLMEGEVACWGANHYGQLGLGDNDARGDDLNDMGLNLSVLNLGNGRTANAVAAGGRHTCAMLDDGSVKCWGCNDDGQLGLGSIASTSTATIAVDFGSGLSAIAVSAGGSHTCAILNDAAHSLKCWGLGTDGQLGIGSLEPGEIANAPTVDLGTNRYAVAISLGSTHTCALLDDANVKCWGSNNYGQLGQESSVPSIGLEPGDMGDTLSPINLGTGRTAVAISAGGSHTCAVLDDGSLKCWGSNSKGQLGLGDDDTRGTQSGSMGDSLATVSLGAGRSALAVSLGSDHTCVLLDDKAVKCWGAGGFGQLGQNSPDNIGVTTASMGDALQPVDLGTTVSLSSCPRGNYLNVRACVTCPSGTWAPVGASTEAECVPCAAGKFGDADGATACSLCPAGTYSTVRGATDSASCNMCDPGKYSAVEGAIDESTCLNCGTGTYAEHAGSAICTNCTAGRYYGDTGATNSDMCAECGEGAFSREGEQHCTACGLGKYAQGPVQQDGCIECEPGTYADEKGLAACKPCDAGSSTNLWGDDGCDICPAGKYSSATLDNCVSCAAGLASAKGSSGASDCQSTTTSFVAGSVLFVITLVILAIYVCFGRARRVAFLEQQTSTPILVEACTAASAAILTRMQRERTTRFLWKLCLVFVTFVALFVAMMVWFITNTFLLSTSFFSPPDWLERFEDELSDFMEVFPLFWFLVIFPPVIRWIRNIDFTFLMTGVRVTCLGAQGPALLFGTAVIVVATVLVVDSQFHAMLALAFVPMTSLVQMELVSASAPSWWSKFNNVLKFAVLSVASAMMMSCSRYVMQMFTTLVEYSSFLPYRKFSPACNDDGIDSALAIISTIVFYACMLPAAFLMLRVLMPRLPPSIRFQLPENAIKLAKPGQYRKTKSVLDWFNPLKWAMRGLYWLMLRLVAMSSARAADAAADFAPTLRHHMQSVKRDEVKARWEQVRREDLPDFLEFLRLLQVEGLNQLRENLWKASCACAWKLKLALLVVCGVWTDEVATAIQIDTTTHEYYGWTQDPKLLHEDVMGVTASMRSMTWMLLPPLIILTKLAEVTNNPPIFVFTDKLHMTSPLLFWSWAEAEVVMLDGKLLLDAIHDRAEKTDGGRRRSVQSEHAIENPDSWEWRLQHNLRVALVWVLGARLPRYVVQMVLLLLVVTMAIDPHMETLILAACIILLWSLVYTLAILLDVRLMLRLRKEQPANQIGSAAAAVVAEVELPEVVALPDQAEKSTNIKDVETVEEFEVEISIMNKDGV